MEDVAPKALSSWARDGWNGIDALRLSLYNTFGVRKRVLSLECGVEGSPVIQ